MLEAVLDTMRYWLDMGVDGLRLDAIPYLIEREGTNCENLPETHEVIKKIRAALDARYPDRMLLAEANQWPEETAPYFGNGDECHMAFHFPLMPRMYMALAQEDRHPITDIMRQTPEIPDGCQWAIFLRNHDELTLEMVTDKERDYLWSFYAAERRARINLGIRRRLAPLLENDRRKIELLNSLLLSMPGTPVLYYGDEIGMGDNIYLGDRDGVRTPMQWSPDRNGGFSRADPARLFLPAIQDPIYGFDAVNVEAQLRSPASLLNWMRRMIAIRRNHSALGRGTLALPLSGEPQGARLYPRARRASASCASPTCRARRRPFSSTSSEFKGATPIEMTGGTAFPPIGDLPYLLTLPAYGFYWFQLTATPASEQRFGPTSAARAVHARAHGRSRDPVQGPRAHSPSSDTVGAALHRRAALVRRQGRAHQDDPRSSITPSCETGRPGPDALPCVFLLSRSMSSCGGGERQTYSVPLAIEEGADEDELLPYARRARAPRAAHRASSTAPPPRREFALAVVEAMRRGERLATHEGGAITLRGDEPHARGHRRSTRARCDASRASRATPRSSSAST